MIHRHLTKIYRRNKLFAMSETTPCIRRDLEFFPVQHSGRKMILIRDHLGIVPEGKAVNLSVYNLLTLLDGAKTVRDLQMEMMRLSGGVLVGSDEITSFLADLDASYLLDSERYRAAKDQIITDFASKTTRHCSLCGRSYPNDVSELTQTLNDILANPTSDNSPEGNIKAIVAPHIDLSAGSKVYAGAYGKLRHASPERVVLLGVGHHMAKDMFCLTGKDFATPLGVVKNEPDVMRQLKEIDTESIADNDFEHRSEHSIEFQVLFLQHLLGTSTFTILPILCGSLMANLPAYDRSAYLKKAGPFLEALKKIISAEGKETLIVAGVDFSHIGLKFGHGNPAQYIESRAEAHDKHLLKALSERNVDLFWEESQKVKDQFNVCGFPALACLLEILPSCSGTVLDYQMHHEAATQSAVSFAAMVFVS